MSFDEWVGRNFSAEIRGDEGFGAMTALLREAFDAGRRVARLVDAEAIIAATRIRVVCCALRDRDADPAIRGPMLERYEAWKDAGKSYGEAATLTELEFIVKAIRSAGQS